MAIIIVLKADITTLGIDAIVNAANNSLRGGGGVDGAIHAKAGDKLFAECIKLNGCATGEAKITKGYNLPAKYVIHTVGPIWQDGENNESQLLANCYKNSLKLAVKYKFTAIAFPAISCGVYGFPIKKAVDIAWKEVENFLAKNKTIQKIYFVCFNDKIYDLYRDKIDAK